MNASYSTGSRAGVPVKFSRKGVIFKTYEGELNVGGLTNSSEGAIPTSWKFSVRRSDENVHRDINRAMEESKRVKLFYDPADDTSVRLTEADGAGFFHDHEVQANFSADNR